jgi:predicted dehydrogenase
LSKVNEWNKDFEKSGDTLVEKCCHFFDLFRLLSSQEMRSCTSKVNRGLLDHHYGYNKRPDNPFPIIDSAYVLMDFLPRTGQIAHPPRNYPGATHLQQGTLGCLELCMYADGSRHQEEIIVTGLKGRLEAYLPENKVFFYQRPSDSEWVDKTLPPPKSSIKEEIIDCSNLSNVYSFGDEIPQHAGHHYCSTAIEWKYLIEQVQNWQASGEFIPQVSLEDGLAAVEMGINAQSNISNKAEEEVFTKPLMAFSTKSSEHLLNLAIEVANVSITPNQPDNDIEYNCYEEEEKAM